uniref:NADase-type glycan-binding domain-containing protein n=1 Tax=Saccharicrinis aurantiacus TaxID=1849719 RepID=UPI001C9E7317
ANHLKNNRSIFMKQIIATIFLVFFEIGFIKSQDIPILEPVLGFELDFNNESVSKFQSDAAFKDCRELFKKIDREGRSGTNDYTLEEQKILFYCDETKDNIWQIEGSGCSWYCGGGPKEVSASSYLKSQGTNSYDPKNAHDLNYKNAWIEGVDGYGIGEYLLYTFEGASPRINEIIVINGYVKSKAAWENNSRVKKLKVYIDNKPYAILSLKDMRCSQSFKIEPIGNSNRTDIDALKMKPDWTLKFEILEVYEGLKYDDVAISEIYFSGLDVH